MIQPPYIFQIPYFDFFVKLSLVLIPCYLILLFMFYRVLAWFNFQPSHPLKTFLPDHLKLDLLVNQELSRYSFTIRLLMAHSASTFFLWMIALYNYILSYPFLINLEHYQHAIHHIFRRSAALQIDKLNFFLNKVSPLITTKQVELINLTQTIRVDFYYLLAQLNQPSLNIQLLLVIIFQFLLVGLVAFFLIRFIFVYLRSSSSANDRLLPYALFIPSWQGLPGWLVLKLIYPIIILILISYFIYRWRKSQKPLIDYIGQSLFSNSNSLEIVQSLKKVRYYLVASYIGGTLVFLVNWFLFLASFVSYRFNGFDLEGLQNLSLLFPEVDQQIRLLSADQQQPLLVELTKLIDQYNYLMIELTTLEQYFTTLYQQQPDLTKELWWLPLVRLLMTSLLLLGFVGHHYLTKKTLT